MKVLCLLLAVAISGCVATNLAPGKTASDAATVNMQLAIEYLRLGKLATARDFIERALKQDSDNASVQMAAGLIYERLGENDKAHHAYAESERLSKGDPDVQNTYAGYLCRTHHAAEGEKLFAEVIKNPLYQTPEVAMVNAGVCLEGSGDDAGADRYFRRALAIRPNMPEAMLESGVVALHRNDPRQAVAIVQRYLQVNPPTSEILWLGLRAAHSLGDENAAAAYAQRLQTQFPASAEAQLMHSGNFQ